MTPATSETPVPTGVFASFRYAFSSPARLRIEVLGGLIVALALIPEAIAFSILAGVDPRMGLFASCTMAITIAFTGGRPAMISAATGAVALVIAPVVREHGVDYFLATIILAGVIQIGLAALGVARLMRFIPRSVMIGFVNALALLVFFAQIPHLIGVPFMVYPLFVAGLLIMILLPRFTTAVPAPLVVIVLATVVVVVSGADVPNVSDQGQLPTSLPEPVLPKVPLNLDTLGIILPYSLAMALVGLMESLLTAKLVDDITESHSDKTRESAGQGIANIVTALLGGMGGCAMIGQTMINVRVSGARTRLSTVLAGVFLLLLILTLGEIVGLIPMAALVAIMVMVSVTTMDWHSISPRTLRLMPLSETIVMLVTVVATLATGNLAIGVVLGVLGAMVMFARRVAHLVRVERETSGNISIYRVSGQLFWASSNDLVYAFDYSDPSQDIVIDLAAAEVWDASTVATLDSVVQKYRARGRSVSIIGLDGESLDRLERLSGKLG
ncbi:SulP family inorganic anion transporter [Corynebacterium pacaense]|uniref:SulP family inorganic anion transporter n=1 Tax=Corynebacterium pacaense TaxID=1816684 RepID=UPI0009BB7E19|nr:SulP family inorganic anion transporter [Corynebacterium pacaense]